MANVTALDGDMWNAEGHDIKWKIGLGLSMRVLDKLTNTLSITFSYPENCSIWQPLSPWRCRIKQFLPQKEFRKNHNHFPKFTARCRWLVSFVSWQFEIFVFTGQEIGGLHGRLGHGGKEESPVSWWNQKPWTSSPQPVTFPADQFHAANRLNYHVCLLTRDVTESDLSEGLLQDCEDVTTAELDSEVECDASDS